MAYSFKGKKSLAVVKNKHAEIILEIYTRREYFGKIVKTISGSREQMLNMWSKITCKKYSVHDFNYVFKILEKTFHVKFVENLFIDTDNNVVVDAGVFIPNIKFELNISHYRKSKKNVWVNDIREEEVEGHYGDERWSTGSYITIDYSGYRDIPEKLYNESKEYYFLTEEKINDTKDSDTWGWFTRLSKLYEKTGGYSEEVESTLSIFRKASSARWSLSDWRQRDLFKNAFNAIYKAEKDLKELDSDELHLKCSIAKSEADRLNRELKRLTWAKYNDASKDNPERRCEIRKRLDELAYFIGYWNPRERVYSSSRYDEELKHKKEAIVSAYQSLANAKKERATKLKSYLLSLRELRSIGEDMQYWDYDYVQYPKYKMKHRT